MAPAAAAAAPAGKGLKSMRDGAVLQCIEAITLGMPLEVWKTHMGRYRNLSTIESLTTIYRENGLCGFWKGSAPKMVESATKGAVLVFAKEAIADGCTSVGVGKVTTGFIAGAGGGVCQTVVMGPCTFLVTATVTGGGSVGAMLAKTWSEKGLRGFYPGGSAIAFRQATNWASRQGFTDAVRSRARLFFHNDPSAKLSTAQDALCGCLGGVLSSWNHPFEVARIEMQARAVVGQPSLSMLGVFRDVVQQYGVRGLFQGILPRMGLSIWQTLFMVTGATFIKDKLG
mmetsp:Transcript_9067/g.23711  ORF Transcript_9067/g.23711 Transcript_9067/m.23711 type:complete len:285 (-) Transcript_9067:299-1153(-)